MAGVTRLIRFVASDDGQVYYGHAKQDLSCATLVEHGDIFLERTNSSTVTKPVKRLLCPLDIVDVPAIYCVGLNYRRHAQEAKMPIPSNPVIFLKPPTCLAAPTEAVHIPKQAWVTKSIDFEAELVVVIGKTARCVKKADALKYVYGYAVGNDISNRTWQLDPDLSGGQWCFSKGFDQSGPIGPAIVANLNFAKPEGLAIRTYVNGERVQDSNLNDMIFSVAEIIEFLSAGMTLLPGTLIFTGTPEGVGFGRDPPVFLQEGDVLTTEIEEIGCLRNKIVFEREDQYRQV